MSKADIRIWGDKGPNLVFIHYFGGEAESWQWVAKELSSDYRCIALSLPGFGATTATEHPSLITMAQWIQRQLALYDVYDCSLIGHSMGGKIALMLAAQPSELEIHQVCLLAPSPPTREPMPEEEKKRMLKHPDREVAAQTVENAIVQPISEEMKTFAIESQLKIDQTTWQWWLRDGMEHSIAEIMPQLDRPVSVLCSEDDPVITMKVIRQEVIPVLPQASIHTCRDYGHLLPLEAPKLVADFIREAHS